MGIRQNISGDTRRHLLLRLRFCGRSLQLYVVPAGRVGPQAGFWHLPALHKPEALGHPAGHHTDAPFLPTRHSTQVWALGDPSRHKATTAHAASHQPGLWLTAAELILGHQRAIMLLSPLVWATVRAVADLLPQVPEQAGLEATVAFIARGLHALWPQPQSGEASPQDEGVALAPGLTAMPLLTPTLPPSTHTNCYLLGHQNLTLVDPGTPYPAQQQDFLRLLAQRVAQGARIEAIWISHFHEDHTGAAMAVHKRFGAPICAHEDTAKALQGRVQVHRIVQDEELLWAEDLPFTAMHTPGHAHGHLSFWAHRGGHLLSGDNILGAGTPIVPPAPHGNLSDYMASLRRVARRPLGLLLPGHGPPCASALRRLQETLRAREAREALLLEVLKKYPEGATLSQLVALLYRGLGDTLRGLAELSTLSHLEKLCHDNICLAQGVGDARRFGRTIAP